MDEVFPESEKQRCTKHRTENVLDKVLEQDKASVKESVQMERRKHVQGGKGNPYKDPGIEDAKDAA